MLPCHDVNVSISVSLGSCTVKIAIKKGTAIWNLFGLYPGSITIDAFEGKKFEKRDIYFRNRRELALEQTPMREASIRKDLDTYGIYRVVFAL